MFSQGLKKVSQELQKLADAPSSPMIDPKKAAAMQRGAMSGGPSMGQAWANLKSGLGFGPSPADAGTIARAQ